MLSRVVPQSEDEAQPVAWRCSPVLDASPFTAPSPVRTPPPSRAPIAPPISHAATEQPDGDFEAQVHQQLQVAFESGQREGENAARQRFESEVRRAVDQLAQAAAEVADTRREVLRRAESDILRLSMEIARRVLHRELSVDPDALGALIRAALEKSAGQQLCRVRVHPDQESALRNALAQMGRAAEIEVVTDPAQARGGALFETDSGTLDASVETQLREIERGFADRIQVRR